MGFLFDVLRLQISVAVAGTVIVGKTMYVKFVISH